MATTPGDYIFPWWGITPPPLKPLQVAPVFPDVVPITPTIPAPPLNPGIPGWWEWHPGIPGTFGWWEWHGPPAMTGVTYGTETTANALLAKPKRKRPRRTPYKVAQRP